MDSCGSGRGRGGAGRSIAHRLWERGWRLVQRRQCRRRLQFRQAAGFGAGLQSVAHGRGRQADHGQPDITEADLGIRQGSSEYLVIYTAAKAPEVLWLRVGAKGMFEEARSAYGQGKETAVDGLGDEAFAWDSKDSDAGVAFLKDGRTYIISTKYWVPDQTTMVMEPAANAEQLMDAAKTVNDRL